MIIAILQQAKTDFPSPQITNDGRLERSRTKQILLRERRGNHEISNPDNAKMGKKHRFFCHDLCHHFGMNVRYKNCV